MTSHHTLLEEARKRLRHAAYTLAHTDRDDAAKRESAIHEHEQAAIGFALAAAMVGATT